MKEGETIYKSLCSTCHGEDGRGVAVAGAPDGAMMAPPLSGSPRVQGHRDYVIKTLLYGMTGPLGGQTYTQVMVPMGAQNDQWIANIASYVRNEFGNTGAVHLARRSRARARQRRPAQVDVDVSRARSDAAAAVACRSDVEGHRQPQR